MKEPIIKNLLVRYHRTFDGKQGTVYSFDGVTCRIYLWVVGGKVVDHRFRDFGR